MALIRKLQYLIIPSWGMCKTSVYMGNTTKFEPQILFYSQPSAFAAEQENAPLCRVALESASKGGLPVSDGTNPDSETRIPDSETIFPLRGDGGWGGGGWGGNLLHSESRVIVYESGLLVSETRFLVSK